MPVEIQKDNHNPIVTHKILTGGGKMKILKDGDFGLMLIVLYTYGGNVSIFVGTVFTSLIRIGAKKLS